MEGRTYRYSNEEPLYPFGYGLSYTRFQYESVNIEPKTVDPTKNFSVTVVVKNVGLLTADEVKHGFLHNVGVQDKKMTATVNFY